MTGNAGMENLTPEVHGSSDWPLTDWSGLRQAAYAVGKDAERLDFLIRKYQKPLKLHLTCTFEVTEQVAEELLQDFAQDKILKEGWLAKANRERGRFRNFLKSSLTNFVRDRLQPKANAPVSLESLEFDIPAQEQAAEIVDLTWIQTILADTLARVEQDCLAMGKPQIWEVFRLRILQPIFEGDQTTNYETLVRDLGIKTPFQAQNLLGTAKRIFQKHLNRVISEYEKSGAAAKLELEDLRRFLGRAAGKKP
jgi:hypothetical protein